MADVISFAQAGSPAYAIQRLISQLNLRTTSPAWSHAEPNREGIRPPLNVLADYRRGEPPSLFGRTIGSGSQKWREVTRAFLRQSRMNYADMVVGSVQDRIDPVAWRTAADDDRNGDQLVAGLAAESDLGVRFADTLGYMLTMGSGYMLVSDPAPGQTFASITAEDPRQAITRQDRLTGRTLMGLKVSRDDWDGSSWIHFWDADTDPTECRQYVMRSEPGAWVTINQTGKVMLGDRWQWSERGTDGGSAGAPIKIPRVPLVEFANVDGGVGEYERHLDVLDRINDGIFDRVSIAKYQAFRQRAIQGLATVYPEGHPQAGETIQYDADMFAADPGALWNLPAGAEIWESQPVDLNGVRAAIKDDVINLAAVTRTPLHMISPDAANGSAEGAATMREAHVFRTKDRRKRCTSPLAKVVANAFALGDEANRAGRDEPGQIRTIWGSTEHYTLPQRAASAAQAKAGGLPQESIWVDHFGYSPDDIERLTAERQRDLFFTDQVAQQDAPPAARVAVPAPIPRTEEAV